MCELLYMSNTFWLLLAKQICDIWQGVGSVKKRFVVSYFSQCVSTLDEMFHDYFIIEDCSKYHVTQYILRYL